jgi:hypothetical protein
MIELHETSRRGFLRAGGCGLTGLCLADQLRWRAAGAVSDAKADIRNCITLFLVGSPGQHDTWDMKPDAPSDVRGPFQPIATRTTGIRICEHFPKMAQLTDKIAFLRSLYHTSAAPHEDGQQWMMTGRHWGAGEPHPHAGSVIARVFGPRSALPPSVLLPVRLGNTGGPPSRCQTAAYLGSAYEPFVLGSDPARADFRVANLTPPAEQSSFRIDARRSLREKLDALQRHADSDSTLAHDTAYRRAFDLISSPQTRRAFDLSEESPRTRDRYGRNTFGQSCLLARRLIERGARFVTVNHFDTVLNQVTWDMHADGKALNSTLEDYERHLCPQFDQAYAALLTDLDERGLLRETLVATLSEMGRTPRLNRNGGRDHYPAVWTNFLAGGNIKGGQVLGASDRLGATPRDLPIDPPRVLASIYHGLGIDLDQVRMPGPGGRPIRLIDAEPIRELFNA